MNRNRNFNRNNPGWYRDTQGVFNLDNTGQGFYGPKGNTAYDWRDESGDRVPEEAWLDALGLGASEDVPGAYGLKLLMGMAPQLMMGGLLGQLFK